jgi:hypothetical protein
MFLIRAYHSEKKKKKNHICIPKDRVNKSNQSLYLERAFLTYPSNVEFRKAKGIPFEHRRPSSITHGYCRNELKAEFITI